VHAYPQAGVGKWRGLFHLLYIRHFTDDDTSEVTFGHAWSSDLVNWTTDRNAFHTLARWDARHVWAPSIVLQGPTYYMFYTGVGWDGRERIGVATTSYLDTTNTVWQRDSAEVFDPVRNDVQWAKKATGRACRDPWVTEYPAGSGEYWMLYVVQDSVAANEKNVVGLAKCLSGNLRDWQNAGRYWSTVNDALYWGATRIESPMAFRAPTAVGGWRLMYTDGGQGDPLKLLRFETGKSASVALTDTVQGRWSSPTRLYDYLGSDPLLSNWTASEHLRLGDFDFFAAFADSGRIRISRMSWSDSNFVLHQSLAAAGGLGSPEGRRSFTASGTPGSRRIEFGVVSASGGVIRLAVYDVLGRRVWDIRDRRVAAGMNTLAWDCVDAAGRRVPAGLYFARCTGGGLNDVAKVVVVF
jgi:sucrose-6-phosphate hydrolase SacC (GH32 family)